MSEEAYFYIDVRDAKTGRILKHKKKKYHDVLEALLAFKEISLKEKWEKEYD